MTNADPTAPADAVTALLDAPAGHRAALCAKLDSSGVRAILSLDAEARARLVRALVEAVEDGGGASRDRLKLGILLGDLGDPRLSAPEDSSYWVLLQLPDGSAVEVGVYPVTNQEFRAFVDGGGYDDSSLWSDEGRIWKDQTEDRWPVLAARSGVEAFTAPNQPVVGVSFFEAEAYANAHRARLPSWSERVFAVRGEVKRPYPWGSPFGEAHANTREESLERPCAVGLYRADQTPEGIFDLAGNVGEWTSERVGEEVLLHPGSWERPSLASWAKASTTASPGSRWSALGFRIARDPA